MATLDAVEWTAKNYPVDRRRIYLTGSSGGGHMTRTVLFHGGKLYVSAGSSRNVCREDDSRRAAVMEFNEDGSNMRIFARGSNQICQPFARALRHQSTSSMYMK